MKRHIYLKTAPLGEALEKWLKRALPGPMPGEAVKVADSLGRVTAAPVYARVSSPHYHSSAMDGYAVRFDETFGASEREPRLLRVGDKAVYVNTGAPMPEGFNAVVMVEDVSLSGDSIEIIKPLTPWKNVRVIGEDIVATELIMAESELIRPLDIGAMLAGGNTEVEVRKRPRVVVMPTGSEIIEPEEELSRGKIIEFNSRVMGGLIEEWGGEFIRYGIVPDREDALREAVLKAAGMGELIVLNAGASAGTRDFTRGIIEELGELVLHGIAIKPGKPLVLGVVNGTPVLGTPGYPVSAYITFTLFAKPLISAWLGVEPEPPERVGARLSRQIHSELGQEEFIRVKVGHVGGGFVATPLGRGAGAMMSLVRADGLLRVPPMSEGLGAGADVEVELMRPKRYVENTLVSIGSHDNTLDILANSFRKNYPGYSLSSAHVGSVGGLIALKKNETHIAPTHLLDEETGEYNVSFVRKYLPHRKTLLINLVYREQGFIVPKGNPKGIKGFSDLGGGDVSFINRQRGAGTRLLLDKHLKEEGIDPSVVSGYDREEFTHMAVASAVLSGVADTGLGILAAARALGLDFVPLTEERYDLAVPEDFIGSDIFRALLEVITSDKEFRAAVSGLGGYDTRDMGKIVYEGE